jgi:Zn-dependent protease with chaperone function
MPGKQQPSADLERQEVVSASGLVDEYGATEPPTAKKQPISTANAEEILKWCLGIYVGFFVVHTLADIAYLITVDARFPSGLDHLYPSEWERKQSITYTRQTLMCSLLARTTMFALVFSLIYFKVFTHVDSLCQQLGSAVGKALESRGIGSCGCCCCGCLPTSALTWQSLLYGSVYIALFGVLFTLVKTPFQYWMFRTDLDFGFTNALTVNEGMFWPMVKQGLWSAVTWGIPMNFMFLAIMQFRFGWLCMWMCMISISLFIQMNMATLSPLMIDTSTPFPNDLFAVGRGFPLAKTPHQQTPWVSLNRLYFKDPKNNMHFVTRDHSPGQLELGLEQGAKNWRIGEHDGKTYARAPAEAWVTRKGAQSVSGRKFMEAFGKEHWKGLAQVDPSHEGKVGIRSGADLRDKIFGFAKANNINISQIYMIDGSSKDARANAFVSGMQDPVIALYDTLFLGQHNRTQKRQSGVEGTGSTIQLFSKALQNVDTDEEDDKGLWTSVPTRAMTDDEIVAILAHELGHAANGHMTQGMVLQSITSFVSFAAMGWAAHSPLFAAALALQAPTLHVGLCVYEHFLGPSLDKSIKLITDWNTRRNEYQADGYVEKLSDKYGSALQTALAKLTVNTNQDPDMPSWYEALHTDHPSTAHRWAAIQSLKEH